MNRIDQIFTDCRAAERKALMPFVTAGYPTLDTTAAILPALESAGASIVELGIPFSDPIADGPVISASMTTALKHQLHAADIFAAVKEVRPKLSMGIVAMVSYSIVHRIGVEKFVTMAHDSGVDGFIFPDLPLEESSAVTEPVREAGLISSLLIAPTTGDDRAAAIARASTGFVYMMARTGITGARADLPADLTDRVSKLRKVTDLPITVGFGISNAEQVRAVTRVADAAIVGSALVKHIAKHIDDIADPDRIAQAAGEFTAELATGL